MSDDKNAPILLDISGRISMESEEMNQIPASGIYLNSEDDDRKTHIKDAIIDDSFPEITHFEVVRDIESREAFDKFLELRKRIEIIAKGDIECDFEIYDELISHNNESLILHVVVENQEISEIYGTIENRTFIKDLFSNSSDVIDELIGEIDDMDMEFDSGNRKFTDDFIKRFNSYVEGEDKSNIRVLPLSFLDSYFKAYDYSDWENTALKETVDSIPYWPIHVEH